MSVLATYWIVAAILCAAGGAAVHHRDRFSGGVLGAVFGPFGLVVAAIANANATMEEIRDKIPRPAVLHGGVATVPGNPNRIICPKCGNDYPRGLSRCVSCRAKAPT